jgi:hypothetical protein
MSKQSIEIRDLLYEDGKQVEPFIPVSSYEDAILSPWNKVTVSASATNEALAISDLSTVKRLDLYVEPSDVDKITVKYNGSSKAYAVSPLEATTENITGITASNSSAAVVNLYWRAVYV